MKLKKWVKVVLALLVIGAIFILNNNEMNNAIDDCVKAGHSQTYCENGLR